MKNALIRNVVPVITVLVVSCNSTKEKPPVASAPVIDKEQIKREIQAKEDEFATTYNGGVVKDIGYYAEDATSFYQNRAPLVGKKAIVDFLYSDLQSNTNKISFRTKEVFVSNDGNQVVEVGAYKVTDSANKSVNTGNYMTLFEKRNGKYVAVRDMSAADTALP